MGFKTFASMNIAIIGSTEIGMAYAQGFATAGHKVYLAWQTSEKRSAHPMPEIYGQIEMCSIEEAAAAADFIIIATQAKDIREAAYWLGDVRRKVIIDSSANVHTLDRNNVNTMNAIKSITGSQHVIKIFNTKGYEHHVKPLFNKAGVQLLLVSDSKKAKEITKIMALELGITEWYDFGATDTLPLFNQLTQVMRNLAVAENLTKPVPHKVK